MCSCERPSELNMAAAKLNELIMPDSIGDAVIDLRALSLREWSVEFLWKLKVAQMKLKEAQEMIQFALRLFQIILDNSTSEQNPVVTLTNAIKQHFTETSPFVHFFVETLAKHFNLWRSVLTVEREVSIIQREVPINSLDFANLSLNLAMPREYLDPPRPQVESDSGAVDAEGNPVTGDTSHSVPHSQASFMVPLSSVETVFNKLTATMLDEAAGKAKNLVERAQTDINERMIK